jgi:hypothetical protein
LGFDHPWVKEAMVNQQERIKTSVKVSRVLIPNHSTTNTILGFKLGKSLTWKKVGKSLT